MDRQTLQQELTWATGFLETSSSLGVYGTGVRVQICCQFPELIERVGNDTAIDRYQGPLPINPNSSSGYLCGLSLGRVQPLLDLLLPYMRSETYIARAQAILALCEHPHDDDALIRLEQLKHQEDDPDEGVVSNAYDWAYIAGSFMARRPLIYGTPRRIRIRKMNIVAKALLFLNLHLPYNNDSLDGKEAIATLLERIAPYETQPEAFHQNIEEDQVTNSTGVVTG